MQVERDAERRADERSGASVAQALPTEQREQDQRVDPEVREGRVPDERLLEGEWAEGERIAAEERCERVQRETGEEPEHRQRGEHQSGEDEEVPGGDSADERG